MKHFLYTIILDHGGGTYVSQFTAPSAEHARRVWLAQVDLEALQVPIEHRDGFRKEILEEPLVALDRLAAAWTANACVGEDLALVNIVGTDVTAIKDA